LTATSAFSAASWERRFVHPELGESCPAFVYGGIDRTNDQHGLLGNRSVDYRASVSMIASVTASSLRVASTTCSIVRER
jgi:hypothetical protein